MTKKFWKHAAGTILVGILALVAAGCISDNPGGSSGGNRKISRYTGVGDDPATPDFNSFRIDDRVQIFFTGSSDPPQNHTERVNDDGSITLALIGSVKAAGLTPKELEEEIQRRYVPEYYKRLSVSVQREDRYYWVSGEVKIPSRLSYLGETTVLRAIASAGHFTDFADKKNVKLTRKSGRQWLIDAKAAERDARYDAPVYPGDRIHVERTAW